VTGYRVYRGEAFLGTITSSCTDWPWSEGAFAAAPSFAAVRSLFEVKRELLEAGRMDEWEQAWREIEEPGLRLESINGGEPIKGFLLHIDGDRARWRA
jgi:hypothetical protein